MYSLWERSYTESSLSLMHSHLLSFNQKYTHQINVNPVLPGPVSCMIFTIPKRVNVGVFCINVAKTVENTVIELMKL